MFFSGTESSAKLGKEVLKNVYYFEEDPMLDCNQFIISDENTGELVLFDYDSSVLTPEAQERLTKKAKWLKDNPNEKIVIEGHCDERGSVEYNLALGERRAEAAKSFLVDMGITASRLTTISYGKERPFVKGHYESAWSLNRRAHFVIE